MNETRKGRWQTGQSGNPRGRPKGSSEANRLREAIAARIPGIIDRLVERAEGGDVSAARLLLERALPALKPVEPTVILHLPDQEQLTVQAEAVIRAIASGSLPSGQGTALLSGLATIARLKELDELEERIMRSEKHL